MVMWHRWRRWLLRLAVLGLLLTWILTWALDAPQRPVLAQLAEVPQAAVHVGGIACQQFSEGAGFAVEPGLVLTNAHVVAGVEEIVVTLGTSTAMGTLVGFDPSRDVAAIAVSGLDLTPLKLAENVATANDAGDVVRVDRDSGVDFVPFSVIRRVTATGQDFYGDQVLGHQVLEIGSMLAVGDSGAGLVNAAGELWGMVFSVSSRQNNHGYALDVTEIDSFLSELGTQRVPTPPCRVK